MLQAVICGDGRAGDHMQLRLAMQQLTAPAYQSEEQACQHWLHSLHQTPPGSHSAGTASVLRCTTTRQLGHQVASAAVQLVLGLCANGILQCSTAWLCPPEKLPTAIWLGSKCKSGAG